MVSFCLKVSKDRCLFHELSRVSFLKNISPSLYLTEALISIVLFVNCVHLLSLNNHLFSSLRIASLSLLSIPSHLGLAFMYLMRLCHYGREPLNVRYTRLLASLQC